MDQVNQVTVLWLMFGQDKAKTRFRGRRWFGLNGLTDAECIGVNSEDLHCCGCSDDDSEVKGKERQTAVCCVKHQCFVFPSSTSSTPSLQ